MTFDHSRAIATHLGDRFPDATLRIFEDTRHHGMEERPREVERALVDLLAPDAHP